MELNDLRKIIQEEVEKVFSEAFKFDYSKTFIPPTQVADRARFALSVVSHNNLMNADKNEGSGKHKAEDLVAKKKHNHAMMKRLKAFFDKHNEEVKKERRLGKNISTSGMIQSWELHGGDAGMKWVTSELGKVNDSNLNTKKNLRKAGGAGINKGMGIFDTTLMKPKQRIHR